MIAGVQGWPIHAARLYGGAEILNEASGVPITPADRAEYDEHVAAARAQVDEAAFAAAWAEGRAMTLDEVITTALTEKTAERSMP